MKLKRKEIKYEVKAKELATRENTDRRLIYIMATPASGSSALAGLLHHLGVNMGKVGAFNSNRGYTTYEDRHNSHFRVELPGLADRFLRLRCPRFREYVTWRFENSHGPVGSKLSTFYPLHDPEPATLPLDIVMLDRPLEQSIEADTRVNSTIADRVKGADKMDVGHHLARAGALGSAYMAKLVVSRILPVKLRVDFYAMLDNPKLAIEQIIDTWQLSVTKQQRRDALAFINPDMIHVRR